MALNSSLVEVLEVSSPIHSLVVVILLDCTNSWFGDFQKLTKRVPVCANAAA